MQQNQPAVKPKSSLYYRVRALPGKTLIFIIEQVLALFIKRDVFFDAEDFPWTRNFDDHYSDIRRECLHLQREMQVSFDVTDLSEEQLAVIDKKRWHFIPLYLYGVKVERHCAMAPKTVELLGRIPYMTTAIFSTLTPGAKIKAHRGAYRGLLRYHFGVDIPADHEQCAIYFRNGKLKYSWENGKSVIFDDTFRHYVINDTPEYRTVLYVDFIRPMPKFLRKISLRLIGAIQGSPYVQNMLLKLRDHDPEQTFSQMDYR